MRRRQRLTMADLFRETLQWANSSLRNRIIAAVYFVLWWQLVQALPQNLIFECSFHVQIHFLYVFACLMLRHINGDFEDEDNT